MKSNIYVDMDGVLAKFLKESSLEEIASPGYFENLPAVNSVVGAVKRLLTDKKAKDVANVYILSSVLSETAANEKRNWLHNRLPELSDEQMLFVPYETPKHEYLRVNNLEPGYLLDDFSPNLREWENHRSGKGIKVLNGINDTHHSFNGYRVDARSDTNVFYNTLLGIILMERGVIA